MKNNDLKAPVPIVPNVPTKFRLRVGPKNVLPGIFDGNRAAPASLSTDYAEASQPIPSATLVHSARAV